MDEFAEVARDRRALVKNALVLGSVLAVPGAVAAAGRAGARITSRDLKPVVQPPVPVRRVAPAITSARVVRPELLRRALASLSRHGARVKHDRIAIVDFAAPSSQPRLHFLDIASGRSNSLLVAHGSGSDPRHTGYLARFSNAFGSNASSEGAFLTSEYYVGKHGRSQRLIGLDPTNDNALGRAIVVHAAWYANKDILRTRGVLGRSQGCFAVGESDLAEVFGRLGEGRMIYATKV
jgi:hypothetical protein